MPPESARRDRVEPVLACACRQACVEGHDRVDVTFGGELERIER
jgi:hypothetical protein